MVALRKTETQYLFLLKKHIRVSLNVAMSTMRGKATHACVVRVIWPDTLAA